MSDPICQTWHLENEIDLSSNHVGKSGANDKFVEFLGVGQR